jgi:hypothetical protein
MAVPVPSISCCVLNHHNIFYQIQNALAFNWDYVPPSRALFTVASFPLGFNEAGAFESSSKLVYYGRKGSIYTQLMLEVINMGGSGDNEVQNKVKVKGLRNMPPLSTKRKVY